MTKTKTRILEKSLEIFNERGVINTTLRQISLALEISQGNLNYHFKTKAEIVEALYFELVRKMDEQMNAMIGGASMLDLLYHSAYKSMRIFFEYRFLMRDFYLILRENDPIKSHYLELSKTRKMQFLTIFQTMEKEEILRPAQFESEYERHYERLNIMGDNWINSIELINPNESDPVPYYHNLLFESIYPYLTPEGREVYQKLTIKTLEHV